MSTGAAPTYGREVLHSFQLKKKQNNIPKTDLTLGLKTDLKQT